MKIVSQDKLRIVECSKVQACTSYNGEFEIFGEDLLLGRYKSLESTIEVMESICCALDNSCQVYRMPKE